MKNGLIVVVALLSAVAAGATTDGVPQTAAQAGSIEKVTVEQGSLKANLAVEKVARVEAEKAASPIPSYIDVDSLEITGAHTAPGIGGGHISVTLKDKGNNTVQFHKPSPAPPRIDRTITATFSPFLHHRPVTLVAINAGNAETFIAVLNKARLKPGYQKLPKSAHSAVTSFVKVLSTFRRASSGRIWSKEQIQTWINQHGAKVRAVPGVLDVSVGYGLAGPGFPFLTITVEKKFSLDAVQAAVFKAVPETARFRGVLGAPNQLNVKYKGGND